MNLLKAEMATHCDTGAPRGAEDTPFESCVASVLLANSLLISIPSRVQLEKMREPHGVLNKALILLNKHVIAHLLTLQ